ncbi:adenosylmethionine decarboxylase [bacterium]
MESLGKHLIVELYDCNHKSITDVKSVEKIMVEAAQTTDAHIVDVIFHSFNPFGVSGVIVIAESHLAIHTWPEYNYASIDIYTCGDIVDPWKAFNYMEKMFKAKSANVMEMKRGILKNQSKNKPLKHKVEK